jgi:cell wall-associated NlpC family hydrolase
VYYLYGKHNIDLHRNASAQMQDGIIVAKEGLQVGDLIFFREPGEYTLCSHVGIYVGNNQIIHSGSKGVVYADLDGDYFADYYLCARRIINTNSTGTTLPGNPNLPPVALPVTGGRR